MMDVLILGKGYVGTALYDRLSLRHDLEVRIISKSELQYDKPDIFEDTIKDWTNLIVINASGYTGRPNVDACETDRDNTWYYNVIVPGMIGDMCRRHNVHNIHISSGCIYDGYSKDYNECDEPNFGLKQNHSSWYSKTKHAGELMLHGTNAHIFRIRMPFCATTSERNILMKLLKYDNIINQMNSLTNIEDLAEFTSKFIESDGILYNNLNGGIYNVVNPEPMSASMIVNAFRQHDISNPEWKYIELHELLEKHTKTGRSNCVLSAQYIQELGLELPSTKTSIDRCIATIKDKLNDQTVHEKNI